MMQILKEILVTVSGLLAVAIVTSLLPFAVKWLRSKAAEAQTDRRKYLFWFGESVARVAVQSLMPLAQDYKAKVADGKLTAEDKEELAARFTEIWVDALGDLVGEFTANQEVAFREAAVGELKNEASPE